MWINGQIINLDYLFMTAVMAMRETTVTQKAHTTYQSLRTIPMSIYTY
jgi:hypothetical protein